MPGPLPNPQKRRRNQPTIPTTVLPAEGRKDPAPDCPYDLGDAGSAWWTWAWALPHATVWGESSLYALARRAQLEDELAALGEMERFDFNEAFGIDDDHEAARHLEFLVGRLKKIAGGSVSLMREMRELDNRFGLNPKGMADLRWSVGPGAETPDAPTGGADVHRLRVVDPRGAA